MLHRDKVRSIKGPVKKKANKKPQLKGINKRGEAFGDPLGDDPIGDDDFNEYDDFI